MSGGYPKPPPDWVLDRIRTDLSYDPESGWFKWATRKGGRPKERAGCEVRGQWWKGVRWDTTKNAWRAFISYAGKNTTLGYFLTKQEAVAARRAAELRYHDPVFISQETNP